MISCSIIVFVCKANSAFSSVRRTHNSNRTPYKRDCKDNTFFSYLQIFSPKKRIFSHLFYKIHTFYQIFHTFLPKSSPASAPNFPSHIPFRHLEILSKFSLSALVHPPSTIILQVSFIYLRFHSRYALSSTLKPCLFLIK